MARSQPRSRPDSMPVATCMVLVHGAILATFATALGASCAHAVLASPLATARENVVIVLAT
jgi:hypothetical protein